MQKPNEQQADFNHFILLVDSTCQKYGLNWRDYKDHTECFLALISRISVKALKQIDGILEDSYLDDDSFGVIHRAVRERIQCLEQVQLDVGMEGARPA